jgi:hypothetical protein
VLLLAAPIGQVATDAIQEALLARLGMSYILEGVNTAHPMTFHISLATELTPVEEDGSVPTRNLMTMLEAGQTQVMGSKYSTVGHSPSIVGFPEFQLLNRKH